MEQQIRYMYLTNDIIQLTINNDKHFKCLIVNHQY